MLKLYIANLGKYNEGELVGGWISLPFTSDEWEELMDRIKICHDNIKYCNSFGSPYEEIAIHDYETDINGLRIGEYDDIDELNELAETLENLDDYDREIVNAILGEGYDIAEAIEIKDDCIVYSNCNSMTDVAYEYVEMTGLLYDVPEYLRNYFDFEAYGRDMSFEGHFVFTDNGNCIQIL